MPCLPTIFLFNTKTGFQGWFSIRILAIFRGQLREENSRHNFFAFPPKSHIVFPRTKFFVSLQRVYEISLLHIVPSLHVFGFCSLPLHGTGRLRHTRKDRKDSNSNLRRRHRRNRKLHSVLRLFRNTSPCLLRFCKSYYYLLYRK